MRARDTSPPKPETQLRLDPPAMTLMLANILNPKEAGLVAADGVDLVDFSDPSRGPIGDLPFDVIAKGVKAIAERSRISAALGDPPYKQDALIAHALKLREAGVNAVRFAVSAGDLDRSEHALKDIADTVDLVGVMFADQKPDFDLIPRLGKIGFKGVLLDVAQKGGRLFDHVESPSSRNSAGFAATTTSMPRSPAHSRRRTCRVFSRSLTAPGSSSAFAVRSGSAESSLEPWTRKRSR